MYLHKSERKGGTYLSIVEGYREGGKVRHRSVESLGYVDDTSRATGGASTTGPMPATTCAEWPGST